jgi:hypothetical protein
MNRIEPSTAGINQYRIGARRGDDRSSGPPSNCGDGQHHPFEWEADHPVQRNIEAGMAGDHADAAALRDAFAQPFRRQAETQAFIQKDCSPAKLLHLKRVSVSSVTVSVAMPPISCRAATRITSEVPQQNAAPHRDLAGQQDVKEEPLLVRPDIAGSQADLHWTGLKKCCGV